MVESKLNFMVTFFTYYSEGRGALFAPNVACVNASILQSQFPDFKLLSGTFSVEGIPSSLCDLICIFSPGHGGVVVR